jgi:hypothetical protein
MFRLHLWTRYHNTELQVLTWRNLLDHVELDIGYIKMDLRKICCEDKVDETDSG